MRRVKAASVNVFAGWLLWAAVAMAADTPPMRFDHLAVDDGLSQNAVLSILQDQAGFLWLGTEDGLNRYDGLDFLHFSHDPADPNSIPNDFIFDLAEGRDGRLWIATDGGGLLVRDPATGQFQALLGTGDGPEIPSHLRSVLIDAQGDIWVGSRSEGLYRVNGATGQITRFLHQPAVPRSLSSNSVFGIATVDGQIWVGTDKGLNRLDPPTGSFEHLTKEKGGLCHDQVRNLLADRRGRLWIGTQGGLCVLSPDTSRVQAFRHDPSRPNSLSNDRVNVLLLDVAGRLWIGTDAGLNLLQDVETGRFSRYLSDPAEPTSLSDNAVVSLFSDRSGVLWVGTKHGGVSKWNPRSWSFNHEPARVADGFSSSNISSFAEDLDGNLWVGSVGGGITVVDRESGRAAPLQIADESLADSRVMSLLAHSSGQMWIGTMGGGLTRLDPETGALVNFRHDPGDPSSLSANGIMSLHEDASGQVWIGTYGGGVNRFLGQIEGFERHLPGGEENPRSLSGERATAIAQSKDGVLWVGTDGGGLNYRLPDSDQWGHYRHQPGDPASLGSDTVYALYAAPSGDLWVGTRAGLGRLSPDGVSFDNVTMSDGLPNDSIYGILPDNEGRLWLTTNRGMARYTPGTGEIRNFNRRHGLQGDEFNFGAWYRSSRGELLVGGSNGYNRFNPGALQFNALPPPVVLTGLELFNRPLENQTPLHRLMQLNLDHTDDVVTFRFVALDYTAPLDNQYRYRLEGFDQQWVDLRGDPRVTYTNLDAGDYRFRVIAANSDGVWNEQGLALAMTVGSPPWATPLAYAAYALAALIGLYLLWNLQRARLQREVAFRERLQREVAERTAELAERNEDLKQANVSLERASLTDPLTGLRNRRFMATEVEREITLIQRHYAESEAAGLPASETLALVMVDLDHFKPINDRYGHAAGDQILLGISQILMDNCRNSDFVVRWGGDEFLVVGRHNNALETEKLAERIRCSVADHIFSIGGGNVARTTASIGFACYPFLPHDPQRYQWEQIAAIADAALYRAKRFRNAWVGYFPTEFTAGVTNLLEAVAQDAQQLSRDGLLEIRESTRSDEQASSA